MRGIPKTIATKHDLEVFQQLYPAECEKYCKELEENRFCWEQREEVASKGVSKVVETADLKLIQTEDGKHFKCVRVEDPTSHFAKLGLKVVIGEIEAAVKK